VFSCDHPVVEGASSSPFSVAESLGLRSLLHCWVRYLGAAASSSLLYGVFRAAALYCLLPGVLNTAAYYPCCVLKPIGCSQPLCCVKTLGYGLLSPVEIKFIHSLLV
jgi:hypothetical protein